MKKKLFITVALFAINTFGQTNYVINFNGANSSVAAGTSVGNGIRSIEFWFKPNVTIDSTAGISGYALIMRDDNTQAEEYGMYIKGTDWTSDRGKLAFFVRYSGVLHEIVSDASAWNAGVWYHVAGVLDPAGGMRLYINGVQQSSTSPAATSATGTDNVNATMLGVWGSVRRFNGQLEEMRIWTRAITPAEIQSKMCQELSPANETGLKAYWKFNEGSGTQVLDATSNGNNGTATNTSWYQDSTCLTLGTYVFQFNGSNTTVDVGSQAGSGLRSVEFWFKPSTTISATSPQTGYSFIIRNDSAQSAEYGVYIKGSDWSVDRGRLAFFVRYSGVLHEILSNSNAWAGGTWYHVAGVIDSITGMSLYIDGVLQSSMDPAATAPTASHANASILGSWASATRFFEGAMDEMRLWTRAITASEIVAKMCDDLVAANETGLRAYWKFNEGAGNTLLDATVNGINGAVTNGLWYIDNYCAVSIAESAASALFFDVYPNPGSGELYVSLANAAGRVHLRVVNQLGQPVAQLDVTGQMTPFDVRALPAGIYFIIGYSEAGTARKKIVISR